METIRVNMTPCEDIKTIHASQNDNEAREWGFELHNNGEKIDSSSISDQLVFKAYEGGTEQILPENTSTPTTSPFKGDIKYPQGLLTDQEFTYRQSPTEEDGLAKITDIKGNTLVWNQLVLNGNFADSSNWYARQSTFTVSNNVLTATPSTEGTERGVYSTAIPVKANHKYLLSCEINPPILSTARVSFGGSINYGFDVVIQANQWSKCQGIVLNDVDRNIAFYSLIRNSLTPSQTIQFRNMMVVDLTQMGLDSITDPSEFTSLFSLPYYAYNQGTLLSFMGNGIKTVGKNLLEIKNNNRTVNGISYTVNDDKSITAQGTATATSYFIFTNSNNSLSEQNETPFKKGMSLIFSTNTSKRLTYRDRTGTYGYFNLEEVITLSQDIACIYFEFARGENIDMTIYPMVRLSTVNDSTYEPYTSSILSLPISTYFPTGMKSAGSVYDELTPTKAITRIGSVDLGSLTWSYNEQYQCFITYPVLTDAKYVDSAVVPNFRSIYKTVSWSVGATDVTQDMIVCFLSSANQLRIRNKNFTDATAFKSAMSGVYLYYELATPTETSFTTASLVTENSEIPLSNDDGVLIGKCTEQLSENPGFFDAKIKLSDGDGTCYSNKIQLHVERSPQ